MINQRDVVPELDRVFDRISVSLNVHDRDEYVQLCRPDAGKKAFDAVLDFIRRAAASGMECTVTALDYPGIDLKACRAFVDSFPGASFRARRYHFSTCEE